MRAGLWVLSALFLGAFVANLLIQDRGYVLVNFMGYVIEMSVPGLVLALGATYAAIRVLAAVWNAPRRLGEVLVERRVRRAGEKLTRGLIHVSEGNWSKGERLLAQSLRGTDAPLISYLLAARAAQLQGSGSRRDNWLKLAYEELPEAETAVLLTQAELQFEHEELEQALATLSRIQETDSDHPVSLALLAKVYHALEEWEKLVALLPRLGSAQLKTAELDSLCTSALQSCWARSKITYKEIDHLWKKLPMRLRRIPKVIVIYALAVSARGHSKEAEKEVRTALKGEWDDNLVLAYGKIAGGDAEKQLRHAEDWLKAHAEDASLLLTAARLCMALELWGKARSYLESSLAMAPRTDAFALYGRLLKQFGEEDNAALAFRSGLSLVTSAVEEMTALDGPDRVLSSDSDAPMTDSSSEVIEIENVSNSAT